jgi:DNA polymerase III, delta subunit
MTSTPRGFEFDVVGARSALALFGALDRARLSHGYLFTGPAGVGKKTFARRLAQSLLCETPKPTLLGYCNHCTGCTLFGAGTHPDFVASDGVVKIGKEAGSALHDEELTARDLVRELSLHGYRSDHRVVLLGDVEFATHEAANALLKFFEEPPAGVIVILTTNASGTLLPTIRSRFVEVPFGVLTGDEVARVLEREGVAAKHARIAADASLGSITRAREVLDGDETGLRGASFAWFGETMQGRVADHGFLRLDDRSLSAGEKRALVAEMLEVVRIAARDWAVLALGGKDAPLLAPDQKKFLASIPKRKPEDVVALLAAVADVAKLSESNVSAGLVVDYLRMEISPRGNNPAISNR